MKEMLKQYRGWKFEKKDLERRLREEEKRIEEHKSNCRKYRASLERTERKIDDSLEQVEEYLSTIDDSIARAIIRLRYVDGLSWNDVAARIGSILPDTCRKIASRYIDG